MIEIGFALLCQSLFAILLWRLMWPQLPPIARRAGMVLFACQVAIFLLYAYSRYGVGTSQYTKWLFNLQMESNLSATFSTVQILLVACISGTNALLNLRTSRALAFFWLTISLGFYLLAIDEYFGLHEASRGLGHFYRLGGALFLLWLCYWVWRSRVVSRLFILLPTGLAIGGFGALVLDRFPYIRIGTDSFWNMPVEEALEMFGILLVLMGVLGLLGNNYLPRNWRRAGAIFLSLSLMSFVLFVSLILAPRVELKYFGQRAHITFHNGALWLRGFRLVDDAPIAGRPLTIRLYINATKPKFMSDGLSLHLVDQKTRESIVAVNHHFSDPQWHRIVGRTYRQSVDLNIPPDFPVNRAFWLVLTLWRQVGDSHPSLTISASDHQQLSDTQVVLRELVIPAPLSTAPSVSLAEFENGFALIAAELPEIASAGKMLAIPFTWQAASDSKEDWVQFLHFVHEEGGALWNHDQQPLGARLPTRLWYEGLRDTETWQFTPPTDLPPGRYAIYTGLYRLSDLARLPVHDSDDMPLPDARVPLGFLTITE